MDLNIHQDQGKIHQVLVKLLDGKHRIFNFGSPTITVEALKYRIQTLTSIPSHHQLLLHQPTTVLQDDRQTLNLGGDFPLVVNLLLRLRGGKGGFGSLLRGAATKAGQKKTNNFDACRDMSGRRLRHVNAEKRLEEWRAEAGERKLEKIAEEFIKKKGKDMASKGKSKGSGVDTTKYVNKYREDSEKCREEVERSVREALKRKGGEKNDTTHPKRFKIWLGKRTLKDSDSEDMDDNDEDSDEGDNKSAVTNNEDHSDSSKEADGSSGSVTDIGRDNVSPGVDPSVSGSEEEKETVAEKSKKFSRGSNLTEAGFIMLEEKKSREEGNVTLEPHSLSDLKPTEEIVMLPDSSDSGEAITEPLSTRDHDHEEKSVDKVSRDSVSEPGFGDELVTVDAEASTLKPFNFDDFNTAAELEVLGMERLKSELQARGLKCGGTLQERASRLFLLKTTPIEMLPKKLLAKK